MRTLSVWLLCAPAAAGAQDVPYSGLVVEAPASTLAMALGNTPFLNASEPAVVFYNPALVTGARGAGGALQFYDVKSTVSTLAAATSWSGGGIALGVQLLHTGGPEGSTQDAQSLLLQEGAATTAQLAATIAYGREVHGVRVGLGAKLIEESVAGDRAATAAVDVGLSDRYGPLLVGLAARNLGPDLDPPRGARRIPMLFTAAVSLDQRPVGPLDLLAAAAVTARRDGEIVPSGGVQLSYWPIQGRTFIARAGLQRPAGDARSPFTFGAAFIGDNITLEYAFQSFDGDGDAHRFGIGWR